MKIIKKVVAIGLATIATAATMSMSAIAGEDDTISVVIDGKTYQGYVSVDPAQDGNAAVDPIPHCDNENKMTRAAVVTASEVKRIQLGYNHEYPYEYVASGYVTMMDGGSPAYHYSRAEMWINGYMDTTSGNKWGYGKVTAQSRPTGNKGTARIFYGTN